MILNSVALHQDNDIQLIDRIKNGDNEAFTIIVKKYRAQVARTVIGMLGNSDEGDDVGQEVFIRLYRSLNNFRGDASLSTYITKIAMNLSLNALSKQKKQQQRRFFFSSKANEDKEDKLYNLPNYDDEHESGDTQELVQKALSRLDPKFRSVIVLRMLDGFSSKETAEALDLPLGTVLSRLTRAQEKLKIELKNLGYEN